MIITPSSIVSATPSSIRALSSLPPDTVLFTVHFDLLPTTKLETTFEWSKVNGMCEYAGYGGTPVYSEATFNDYIWTL